MENLAKFLKGIDFQAVREKFFVYLGELKNFQFSIDNPLFWTSMVILLLILLRFWEFKKAFSFCLIVAIVLLAIPKLEAFAKTKILPPDEAFKFVAVRAPALLFISFIFIYYVFLKD